jgi:hypothetical protein
MIRPEHPFDIVIYRLHKKGCAFRNRAFEKSKPRYPLSFLDNSRFQFRKIHHSVNFKRTRAHPKWIYKYDHVVICRKEGKSDKIVLNFVDLKVNSSTLKEEVSKVINLPPIDIGKKIFTTFPNLVEIKLPNKLSALTLYCKTISPVCFGLSRCVNIMDAITRCRNSRITDIFLISLTLE